MDNKSNSLRTFIKYLNLNDLFFMEILAKQCKKSSRAVQKEDLIRVKQEGKEMFKLCYEALGKYPGALALAHCQVDHKDPLRFFVLKDGEIIINPKIDDSSFEMVRDTEGCLSYPFRDATTRKRHAKLEVSYQRLTKKGTLQKKKEIIEGLLARIFQHEIDHMNGISIYFQ